MAYVIMLDKHLEMYKNDWPVVKRSDDIATLLSETQWSGIPTLVPRAKWNMDRLKDKSLIDAQTGSVDAGAIYRQTPKN